MRGPSRIPHRGRRPVVGRVVVVGLAILAALILVTALIRTPIFQISRVTVLGDPSGKITPEILQLVQNQNIFLIDESHVQTTLKKNPLVKDLTFSKSLPNSITVTVTFRDPTFSWQGKNGVFLVDDSGFVFQSGPGAGLPTVISQNKLILGQSLPSNLISRVSQVLKGTQPYFVSINTQPTAYLVALTGGTTATFDPTADLDLQSQALQLILAKAKIDGKLPRTVDLRFPKPVVTY